MIKLEKNGGNQTVCKKAKISLPLWYFLAFQVVAQSRNCFVDKGHTRCKDGRHFSDRAATKEFWPQNNWNKICHLVMTMLILETNLEVNKIPVVSCIIGYFSSVRPKSRYMNLSLVLQFYRFGRDLTSLRRISRDIGRVQYWYGDFTQ